MKMNCDGSSSCRLTSCLLLLGLLLGVCCLLPVVVESKPSHGDKDMAPELAYAHETPVEACLFACQRCYEQMRDVLLDCANNLCLARGDLAEKVLTEEFWIKSCPNMELAISRK